MTKFKFYSLQLWDRLKILGFVICAICIGLPLLILSHGVGLVLVFLCVLDFPIWLLFNKTPICDFSNKWEAWISLK